jgi:short-subunit dehydrogenase
MSLVEFYKDKVVIVTGASMGIGKEIAAQVLSFGGKVVITGRNKERLVSALNELGNNENILIHQGDVTNYESNVELVNKTIQKFGRIDSLINNAGLSCFGEVDKMKPGVAKEIIDANIFGSLFPSMACIPELKKSKGSIMFLSSLAGFHGLPQYSAYSLSKMSLKALSQSMHIELQSEGVFVGIAYVSFTENEAQKKTLSPTGEWVDVPARSKKLTVTRSETALKILNQIKNQRFSKTHSFLGNFTNYVSRHFPRLTFALFKWNYKRTLDQANSIKK